MSIDQVDQTVVTETPVTPVGEEPAASQQTVQTESRHTTRSRPEGSELTRRVTVLVFGLIQIVIGARIILLVLDAREANGLVSGILNVSQFFVAPFNGILHTNALTSGGSILDVAAILALVGWSVLELIVIWGTGIFRREPAYPVS
jgi:YGGT family